MNLRVQMNFRDINTLPTPTITIRVMFFFSIFKITHEVENKTPTILFTLPTLTVNQELLFLFFFSRIPSNTSVECFTLITPAVHLQSDTVYVSLYCCLSRKP